MDSSRFYITAYELFLRILRGLARHVKKERNVILATRLDERMSLLIIRLFTHARINWYPEWIDVRYLVSPALDGGSSSSLTEVKALGEKYSPTRCNIIKPSTTVNC